MWEYWERRSVPAKQKKASSNEKTKTQKYTNKPEYYFLIVRLMVNENQKVNCMVFNTLIHHNSFWNRSSGRPFSIICGLIVFDCSYDLVKGRKGLGIEAVVCFSYRCFVLRRLSFKIGSG